MKKKRIRIIPSILIDYNKMVKGENFQNHKYLGDIFNAVRIYSKKNAHELIILDRSARKRLDIFDTNLLEKISSEIFMPITVGGNVSSVDQAKKLVNCGAEKIYLNSTVIDNYKLIEQISCVIGNQSVVVGVDTRLINSSYKIYYKNGSKLYNKNLIDHLNNLASAGAGEILINSIDREGTRTGFDIQLYKLVHDKVNVPLIAGGGAASFQSFIELFDNTNISAAISSSLFCLFGKNKAVLINYLSNEQLQLLIDRYE